MNSIINYLIEVNLGLVFLYGIYWALLKNETAFQVKRFYLLASILFSLVFPLISISVDRNSIIPSLSNSIPTYWLPEIVITAEGTAVSQPAPFVYWTWVTALYLGVATLLVLLLFVRIGTMIRLFQKSRHYTWKKYTIAESEKVTGVFSFFQFIFLPPVNALDTEERQEILQHEEIHIQQFHSFDILLIHYLEIICWFNPIIKAYKISLVQVHEFEADARSVEGKDVNRYCSLLAKVALQQNGYVLANHFTNSFTLKRITMMKTVRKKIRQWKLAASILTGLVFFIVVACQDQFVSEIKNIGKNSSMALEYPVEVQKKVNEIKSKHPQDELIVIELNEEGKKQVEALNYDKDFFEKVSEMAIVSLPEIESAYVVIAKGDKVSMLSKITKSEGDIFIIVEESAHPKGGMEEFYRHLATVINYPAEARQKGIEGRVFVEFVVNTNGSISDVVVIKGIGSGCDEEAARVVALANPWNPGMVKGQVVRQRMVVPIIFKLSNSDTKIEGGQASGETLNDLVVVGHNNN
ncbi:MAG: TonB family protein [Cyclobacteriaceae bacterium]|nr:TonB family protein [Cyclobacteriaceae bacterium]